MNHNDLNHFTNHANYFDLWEERPYKLFNLSESPTQKNLKRKVDEIIPSIFTAIFQLARGKTR